MIALKDIEAPMFVVGTETDHIAPWRSVYKIQLFTDNELTFLLTTGGHNAGIVSEPGHRGRRYVMATRKRGDRYIDSDTWLTRAEQGDGPVVPGLGGVANQESDAERVPSPVAGAPSRGLTPLCAAPGSMSTSTSRRTCQTCSPSRR